MRSLEKLAVDANPVLSALIGGGARAVFVRGKSALYTTAFNFREVERYIPHLSTKRGLDVEDLHLALSMLNITVCDEGLYKSRMKQASKLIGKRDPDDCHLLALAISLGCPIWSNDRDFDGCGVRVYGTKELLSKYGPTTTS